MQIVFNFIKLIKRSINLLKERLSLAMSQAVICYSVLNLSWHALQVEPSVPIAER